MVSPLRGPPFFRRVCALRCPAGAPCHTQSLVGVRVGVSAHKQQDQGRAGKLGATMPGGVMWSR